MPEHESWFSLYLPALFHLVEGWAQRLNSAITGHEGTWIAGEPYGHKGASVDHVVSAAFVVLVVGSTAFRVGSKFREFPQAIIPEERLTLRTFFEILIEAVLRMMEGIMGKKAARHFLPLIGTCAVFIFFSNAIGLIPGFSPPTDSLKTTLALALVIFFATHIYGIKENGWKHIAHFFGPWLGWIWIPINILHFVIEVISHIARPISLSLRLMANMFGDHMVIGIFTLLVPFLVPVPFMFLGFIVVVVQTAVFCILSTVYIGMAIEHHHDEGDSHAKHH
ncbi:MAG: F0F1 ATP synthase subunit A [Sandaracinaceae bacterium]|nr:F0F1 ATP synthase subunit A [Sandaracinaceae bacterium]